MEGIITIFLFLKTKNFKHLVNLYLLTNKKKLMFVVRLVLLLKLLVLIELMLKIKHYISKELIMMKLVSMIYLMIQKNV